MTRPLWVAAVVVVLTALASASPEPIRFPDDGPRGSPGAGAVYAPGYGQHQPQDQHYQQQDVVYRNQAGGGASDGRAAPNRYAIAEATVTPLPTSEQEGRILLQQHKRKKKKRKKICNLASLLAGRDAAGVPASAAASRASEAQHRAARAVPGSPTTQQGVQGVQQGVQQGLPGDGRSYGTGLGLAGFVLGTLVGSKLGYGFHQAHPGQQPVNQGGIPPTFTQTQTQVQGPVQPLQPVAVPVVPLVPVDPAPVHEDYDDVDQDDPQTYAGGGGSLCDQLQQRPDPGPLDSHFPLIHGLLNGQGGQGGQRPLYRPPPPRPPAYGYYKPQLFLPQQQHYGHGGHGGQGHGGLLYSYLKPWTDLFFK